MARRPASMITDIRVRSTPLIPNCLNRAKEVSYLDVVLFFCPHPQFPEQNRSRPPPRQACINLLNGGVAC